MVLGIVEEVGDIFQAQLVMQNVPDGSGEGFAGIELDGVGRDEGRSLAKVDLTLTVLPAGGEGMIGGLSYAADLWDAATMERMTAHLATLLASAVESPPAQPAICPPAPATTCRPCST